MHFSIDGKFIVLNKGQGTVGSQEGGGEVNIFFVFLFYRTRVRSLGMLVSN